LARDRGCRAGGQKLPSEIVATVEQFEPQARTAIICICTQCILITLLNM